jgi:inosine-uridine nucleoside N-ribohydrolase
MKKRLLIDTDPGVDDALAIYLALGSPDAELVGLTTSFGNADITTVTRNARYILDTVDSHSLEVYRGSSEPLSQAAIASVVHGVNALGRVEIPAVMRDKYDSVSAVGDSADGYSALLDANAPGARVVVVLGPLTNLARFLAQHKNRLERCDRLVVLGGTLSAPGNKGPVAEFNFRCDPEAADYVLANCPCEITLVPLDLCMRSAVPVQDLNKVENQAFRRFLHLLCDEYAVANNDEEGLEGIIMYDPLAVFCALRPEHFVYERFWMRVDTGNSFARGMSVVDRRLRSDLARNVSIATNVNWDAFVDSFFTALNRIPFKNP